VAEQKAHKPTQRKLEKARKEGKVLKSPLIAQTLLVTACIFTFILAVRISLVSNKILLEYIFTEGFRHPEVCFVLALKLLVKLSLISLAPAVLVAILAEAFQVGIRVEFSLISPKASKFDMVKGLAGIFKGLKSSWQFFIKFFLFSWVLFIFFRDLSGSLPALFFESAEAKLDALRHGVLTISYYSAMALTVSALFDYVMKRRTYQAELSMSDDELRREYKDQEGDPHMRSARRAMHESLLMQDVVRRVRRARVIVVEKA